MYLKVKVAKFIYLSFVFLWGVTSCSLMRKMPANNYLLKSNKILIDSKLISKDEISYILKQQPNEKVLGIALKLRIYNSIDSSKLADRRQKSFEKFTKKIERKKVRYSKINQRRIEKARSKKQDYYTEMVIKDTIYNKLLFLGSASDSRYHLLKTNKQFSRPTRSFVVFGIVKSVVSFFNEINSVGI